LVLAGGRVVDPETGFDGICDVGTDGDSVTAVAERLHGATIVDVGGLVVAPGFVDLHSHAHTLPGRRLQACDGVTTALDLEAGRPPVEIAYAREAKRGSPINYGFSASWAAARMHVIADAPLDGSAAAIFGGVGGTEWQHAATAAQVARILDQIWTDLAAGAIGVGVLIGYTSGVEPSEYLAVAELAAAAAVPTFTHSRDIVELAPETVIDGAEELVRAASTTGAHMRYCHINSASG
jgi:dihydroorotase-like cyclic amidohydrolase